MSDIIIYFSVNLAFYIGVLFIAIYALNRE